MTIPAEYRDLVGAPHYAHIVTLNADGSPQSTVVWIERDGDGVVFTTGAGYRKGRNMSRDPRVALSIHDAADPYRCLELRGSAQIEPSDSYDLLDRLARGYLGTPEYPYKTDTRDGIRVRIPADRAVVHHLQDPPVSRPVQGDSADLLGAPHFGHVATVTPAGFPCSSPVWIARDGDDVVFWTNAELKLRNLRHNPAIAISVHDEADPMRYIEVRGVAELTPVSHADLLDELARRYWEVDEYPNKPVDIAGVEVRVKVQHTGGFDGRSWRSA